MKQDRFRDTKERFQEIFTHRDENLNGMKTHPWFVLKRQAMADALELGFPDRKNENWKYTQVYHILDKEFTMLPGKDVHEKAMANHPLRDLDCIPIVVVNGKLDSELSHLSEIPDSISLRQMNELEENSVEHDLVKAFYTTWLKEEDTGFLSLNLALSDSALLIDIPEGVTLDKPLHIVNYNLSGGEPLLSNPLLIIRLGKNSKARVLESEISYRSKDLSGSPQQHFTNAATYVNMAPNAHLEHFKVQLCSQDDALIHNTRVLQARDSHYRNFSVDLGGKVVRNNVYVRHLGSGLTTDLYGVYLPGGEQHVDNQSFIDHAHPHCQSNELYKGIVAGKAKAIFNGKIIVRQDAQKTNAFQQNANMLLSDDAVVDSKPQLEIFADDVRCSHGATIGQLDEVALFYLKSRGLRDQEAKAMLQHAFLREVLDFFTWEELRIRIDQLIQGKFVQRKIQEAAGA